MHSSFESAAATAIPVDIVRPDTAAAWAETLDTPAAAWVKTARFKPESGQVLLIPGPDGTLARVAAGLDRQDDTLALGAIPKKLADGVYRYGFGLDGVDAELACFAWAFGSYRFTKFKGAARDGARLALPDGIHAERVSAIADGTALVRDLVNMPANDLGPAELENEARVLAQRFGAGIKVITGDALLTENFPLVHAVGRAATAEPRLIDLTWGRADAPSVTLVGKGVCFDTGGLNIKPEGGMVLMKKDMGGAAHALGLASMIMAMGLDLRLRVIIPAVENAISGNAFRPGDIYKSRRGLTVEIANTDAEGRLVLADAMALADEESPDVMITLATLTGAARVAVGPDIAPFYTDDDALAQAIAQNGAAMQDEVWRLPLYKPYTEYLGSSVADINHIGGTRHAGSILAALFLSRFTEKAGRWAHFDLFAWNDRSRPGRPVGANAQAIRGLFHWMESTPGVRAAKTAQAAPKKAFAPGA